MTLGDTGLNPSAWSHDALDILPGLRHSKISHSIATLISSNSSSSLVTFLWFFSNCASVPLQDSDTETTPLCMHHANM